MVDLVTVSDPSSHISEAYRTLRTNLSFYNVDNPLQTLVCASAEPNESKSEFVANLAATMAQGGKRTILIDGDLRRPHIHTIFGLDHTPGLTEAIIGDTKQIPVQETDIENLYVLTSGTRPPNPADLLGSRKLDELLDMLRDTADIIIIDAPPIIAVTDTIILGSKVDGVLMVITSGQSRRDHAERARDMLNKANIRIVGATLTDAPREELIDSYYG